ncbi:hypothetical protein DCAR_0205263 [Daucus carota subsp. sativus]|uniref:Factor of DNA methylation 1-5/IDN2 domain-containing protein n=1 Tax=Daucus carota subsp. sativus TaxID=79200 RepID=A0AAF0WC34_DAUCS|nr:hypothetical protein DCAR_0205263 [Daucus carota subsp. sativus]
MEHNSERGPQGDGVLGGVVSAGDAGVVAANGGGAAVDSVLRPINHGEDVEEMKKKMESLEEKLKETEEKLKEKDEDFESLQNSYQALLLSMTKMKAWNLFLNKSNADIYICVVAANAGVGAGYIGVMRPNNNGEYVEMKKKMESLEEKLKEKDEDFEGLQDSYQALLVKERNNNDQLQDARKKLINDRRTSMRAYTSVKLMGDLNLKPIISAAKIKYPPAEIELKAMEFSSLLEEKLRDPNWYPFKVITFGEDSKVSILVINDEDESLMIIKSEWGDEVYNSVVTALTELNDYNSSGRYPVPELWNFKVGKTATLGEGVDFMERLCKTNKRRN